METGEAVMGGINRKGYAMRNRVLKQILNRRQITELRCRRCDELIETGQWIKQGGSSNNRKYYHRACLEELYI